LSSTHNAVTSLQKASLSRTKRVESVKETQVELESRANTLLRKLLTVNQPQPSEAEEKWFKELRRVKTRLNGQRGLLTEIKNRIAEGRRFVELAGKRIGEETDDEIGVGKRKLDGRVTEAIEEAYVPLVS
jgi:hypothetical protein